MAESREKTLGDILSGVDNVPCLGVPGTCIVFGASAQPILTGANQGDVMLAIAKHGKGRVAVFSHEAYLGEFLKPEPRGDLQKLFSNLRTWLGNGKHAGLEQTLNFAASQETGAKRLNEYRLVVCNCIATIEESDTNQSLLTYVSGGGSLLLGACPWGWLQLNPGKSLEDMPLFEVLKEVGVCFTPHYLNFDSGYVSVKNNKAEQAHLGEAIQRCTVDPQILKKYGDIIASTFPALPACICAQFDENLQKIAEVCKCAIAHNAPSADKPVSSAKMKAQLSLYVSAIKRNTKDPEKAIGIEKFPGDFDGSPPLVSVELKVTSQCHDVYPTGYYLPAGQTLTLILHAELGDTWMVQVGAHTDNLTNLDAWRRYPDIVTQKCIKTNVTTISSPFGGQIYLFSPKESWKRSVLSCRLDNVVESPYFDATSSESVAGWKRRKQAAGLWADICGQFIIVTLPSSSVRNLEDPGKAISLWDKVVVLHHHLRGTNVQKSRRQWVVADEQPSAGYMHSGYPVVTHLDITQPCHNGPHDGFVLDPTRLRKSGCWGLFHEIGHNMQRTSWTFKGTVEVTCNIFTLHAMDVICGIDPLTHPWLAGNSDKAKDYLTSGAVFQQWQENPEVGLAIYAQLAHHFGWDSFKAVFRRYEANDSASVSDTSEQVAEWVTTFSQITGFNLCPLFQFWGLPVKRHVTDELRDFQPYLPDDIYTQMSPVRVARILMEYTNCCRSGRKLDMGFSKSLEEPLHMPTSVQATTSRTCDPSSA